MQNRSYLKLAAIVIHARAMRVHGFVKTAVRALTLAAACSAIEG
jgi:hypothetical protein